METSVNLLNRTSYHSGVRFARRGNQPIATPNERIILDLVRRKEGLTRADLMRLTGLTAQSVSRIADQLLQRQFLIMGEPQKRDRGQPSIPIKLNNEAVHCVGFSITSDSIYSVMMDFAGRVIDTSTKILTDYKLESIIDAVEQEYVGLVRRNPTAQYSVFGLGVGVAGFFLADCIQLNPPQPLNELAFIDLASILTKKIGLPVSVDNDGNVAAVGESLYGVGSSFDSFAYLAISKGLGGGLILDRKVYRGSFGNGGEFTGVLPPDVHHERPTLELLRQILWRHGHEFVDLNELIKNFDPRWAAIDEWIDIVLPHLETIVVAIQAVVDPKTIVLGGRVPSALGERLAALVKIPEIERRGALKPNPTVIASTVKGDATAIGAAALMLKDNFFV
jgi:predicted NBD/HSP70 family sugar kinase